jgi:hypothetical protein
MDAANNTCRSCESWCLCLAGNRVVIRLSCVLFRDIGYLGLISILWSVDAATKDMFRKRRRVNVPSFSRRGALTQCP